jgi:hypothetical protein
VREAATLRVTEPPYGEEWLSVDESKVTLSKKNLARVAREARQVAKLWRRRGPARFSLPLAPPLAGDTFIVILRSARYFIVPVEES